MSDFETHLKSVSLKFNDRVLKSCERLFQWFSLNEFWSYRVTNDGNFTYIGSHAGFDEYFSSQKFYANYSYFHHPQYFKEGVIIMDHVQDQNISKVVDAGHGYRFYHPIQIIQKRKDGMEVFGICSSISAPSQLGLILSELPLLKLFLKKFKEENRDLFFKLEENKINLANMRGSSFLKEYTPEICELKNRRDFLRVMGLGPIPSLTKKETEIADLLLNGDSSSKLGNKIYLSKRTIEHHIDRLKMKLDCDSKSSLIKKIRELKELKSL